MDELWGVFHVDLVENGQCYNSTTLYIYNQMTTMDFQYAWSDFHT